MPTTYESQEEGSLGMLSLERDITPLKMDGIGERIRRARVRLGWSQLELSRQSGISQGTISALEAGKGKRPASTTLAALAAALGVEMGDLTLEARPSEDDLSDDTRERIAHLRPSFRLILDSLLEQGAKLPDTPEGIAAFESAIRAALDSLELEERRRGDRS